MRFDTDFGSYMTGAPTGATSIPELKQSQVDILYAFLGGRRIGGRVDFQLGRQIHFDLVDFYAFDGADVLVHATRLFARGGVRRDRGARRAAAVVADLRARRHERGLARSGDPAGAEFGDRAAGRRGVRRRRRPTRRRSVGAALVPRASGRRPPTGCPASRTAGIDDEKVASLTATASWRNARLPHGGIRYNLLFASFDDEQLAVRVRRRPRQWLALEMTYLAPTFDGDSIWNIFAIGAYRDLRGSYEIGLSLG